MAAAPLPALALGSTWALRAAKMANSAATKKALAASNSSNQTIPHQSLATGVRPVFRSLGRRAVVQLGLRLCFPGVVGGHEAHAVDPQAVHAQHRERASRHAHAVSALRNLAELGHDVAADGVVVLVLVDHEADALGDLVEPQHAGQGPRVVGLVI